MKIGIIGPPQSGKTTLFKVILKDPGINNIGVVKIADERLKKLSEAFSSEKITFVDLTFLDLDKRESSKLHDVDMFLCVIGAFLKGDLKKEFSSLITDLEIADLEMIQNRLSKIKKEKSSSKMDLEREFQLLKRCQDVLSEDKRLLEANLNRDEERIVRGFKFLSLKPLIVILNISEENLKERKALEEPKAFSKERGIGCLEVMGALELEVLELGPDERETFSREMGIERDFRESLRRIIFKELNVITFFTVVGKEARAWIIQRDSPVIEAAGKIHSDMRRGFIRAEVVNYEDFIKCGSIEKARLSGLLKVEGKDYIVEEGDIINVRFNV